MGKRCAMIHPSPLERLLRVHTIRHFLPVALFSYTACKDLARHDHVWTVPTWTFEVCSAWDGYYPISVCFAVHTYLTYLSQLSGSSWRRTKRVHNVDGNLYRCLHGKYSLVELAQILISLSNPCQQCEWLLVTALSYLLKYKPDRYKSKS